MCKGEQIDHPAKDTVSLSIDENRQIVENSLQFLIRSQDENVRRRSPGPGAQLRDAIEL